MKKTNFLLTAAFAAIFTSAMSTFGQETLIPGPVQDEQKLMVTVRLKINDNQMVRVEKQQGFLLYPQTVITVLSPLLLLGARTTVISQGQEVPALALDLNVGSGLVVLMLVRPISISVDTRTTNLFSEDDFGENTFMLTSQSVTDIKDLKENTKDNYLRGAVAVDDHGILLGIVSMVEKNDAGTLVPKMIPFYDVGRFIEFLNEGPPVPEMPKKSAQNSEISLNKI